MCTNAGPRPCQTASAPHTARSHRPVPAPPSRPRDRRRRSSLLRPVPGRNRRAGVEPGLARRRTASGMSPCNVPYWPRHARKRRMCGDPRQRMSPSRDDLRLDRGCQPFCLPRRSPRSARPTCWSRSRWATRPPSSPRSQTPSPASPATPIRHQLTSSRDKRPTGAGTNPTNLHSPRRCRPICQSCSAAAVCSARVSAARSLRCDRFTRRTPSRAEGDRRSTPRASVPSRPSAARQHACEHPVMPQVAMQEGGGGVNAGEG